MDYIGNHCLGVVCDGESYEKVLIFGGISNEIGEDISQVKSHLSNRAFLVTLHYRTGKSLFKQPEPDSKHTSKMAKLKKHSTHMVMD